MERQDTLVQNRSANLQNGKVSQAQAAEIKLRAERKAGEFLLQLVERQAHGGDRKSMYQRDTLIFGFKEVIQEQEIPQATAHSVKISQSARTRRRNLKSASRVVTPISVARAGVI